VTELTEATRPWPEPTPVSEPFWRGLREHVIRIQYSPSSAEYVFYPRLVAPGTLAGDLVWREIDGLGTLYTYTLAHRPTAPFFAGDTPQFLAVVQWDAGPRCTTELVDVEPGDIRIGMRVRPVFCDFPERDITLLRYTRA
jgi:uncharacterized OB-fold protein